MKKHIPLAIPVTEPVLTGANGTLFLDSRIKTLYQINGEIKWYYGNIIKIHNNNICSILYDVGFTVKGDASPVFLIEPEKDGICLKKKSITSYFKCIPYKSLTNIKRN